MSVSATLLVFSAPVTWVAGVEESIADIINTVSPQFAADGGPATSVPVSGWLGTPPAVGDPWAMVPPMSIFTAAPPAAGFANSAGLITA